MSTPKHLSWENFNATVFRPGQQGVHRLLDKPRIEVFGDGVASRIGVLIETVASATLPPALTKLTFISARLVSTAGLHYLELATTQSTLYRPFYHFVTAVAERVSAAGGQTVDAVELELGCFTDLLREQQGLGITRQIGLLGELVFLERLMTVHGPEAVNAWHGPSHEPHDFRIVKSEFEVKATVKAQRIHTMNGPEQLLPSKGCNLSLVSVLLGPPGCGDGFSLQGKVQEILNALEPHARLSLHFRQLLEANDYLMDDSDRYTRRFVLRRPLGLVHVNDSFPAITRPRIQSALGESAARVEALWYDVNVEGLETEDGTASFEAALS